MRPCPVAFPNPNLNPALLGLVALSLAAGAWAKPETLTFVKGKTDTFHVLIDYDRLPDVPSEGNRPWEEIEKDSVYSTGTGDDETLEIRFVKAFYAEMNGRKGYATDYIHYSGPPAPRSDRDPVYTTESEFHFPDGSSRDRLYNLGVHLNDFSRLPAPYREGAVMGTPFGLESGSAEAVQVDLVDRTEGWEVPVAVGPSTGPGRLAGAAGWLVRLDGSRVLRVPEGRSRVRLMDVTGRSAWQAEGLRPGEELALPDHLGPGAFRYQWSP